METQDKLIPLDVFNKVVQDVEVETGCKLDPKMSIEEHLEKINANKAVFYDSELGVLFNEDGSMRLAPRQAAPYDGVSVVFFKSTLFKNYTL